MFDRDAFHDQFTEETSKAASSTDAVNGAVGFYSFVAAELRRHASNPAAVTAIADVIDERKVEIAQASVLNTAYEPNTPKSGLEKPGEAVWNGKFHEVRDQGKPQPVLHGGTEALPGDGTVEQPKADTPSYAPHSGGVDADTAKSDTDRAAEDRHMLD